MTIEEKAVELNAEILTVFTKGSKIWIKWKCKTHPNKPERVHTKEDFLKLKNCTCRLKYYTKEDFIEDIKDTGFELIGEYKKDGEKVKLICKNGHEFEATPNKIKQGRGCPFCKREKLKKCFMKSTEQFIKDLEKANPSLELVGEYKGSHNEVNYKCKICNRISKGVADKLLQRELGCRFCNSSIGEQIITILLENRVISFIREKKFNGCKNEKELRFDFYLPDYNACIEFQGEQHFKPVDFSYTPTKASKEKAEKVFKDNLLRDSIKKEFCKQKGLKLIEITYKQINEIEQILSSNLL